MTARNGIGEAIRQARRAKINPATGRCYSQEQAAAAVGTTRTHWNRWEQGVYKPSPEYVRVIGDFLGIPLNQLEPEEVAA